MKKHPCTRTHHHDAGTVNVLTFPPHTFLNCIDITSNKHTTIELTWEMMKHCKLPCFATWQNPEPEPNNLVGRPAKCSNALADNSQALAELRSDCGFETKLQYWCQKNCRCLSEPVGLVKPLGNIHWREYTHDVQNVKRQNPTVDDYTEIAKYTCKQQGYSKLSCSS